MASKELIRGTLKTLILKLLAGGEPMYGYEITQQVKALTQGEIQLTFGALYPVLHKLEADGLLVTETRIVDNRARKYYTLTPSGGEIAKEKMEELQQFIHTLQSFLDSKPSLNLSYGSINP